MGRTTNIYSLPWRQLFKYSLMVVEGVHNDFAKNNFKLGKKMGKQVFQKLSCFFAVTSFPNLYYLFIELYLTYYISVRCAT